MSTRGQIRVGIGGWNYEPWRETFYPANVTKKGELEYASSKVTAIEINSTFYRLQKPEVFAKWRDSTPEGFIFSVKAPRFIAQRRVLAGRSAAPRTHKAWSWRACPAREVRPVPKATRPLHG